MTVSWVRTHGSRAFPESFNDAHILGCYWFPSRSSKSMCERYPQVPNFFDIPAVLCSINKHFLKCMFFSLCRLQMMYIGNLSLHLSFFPYYWIFFKRTVFLARIFRIWMLFVGLGPVGLAWACCQSENQCHIHCTRPKGQKCHSLLTLLEYKSMCKDSLHDSLHSQLKRNLDELTYNKA